MVELGLILLKYTVRLRMSKKLKKKQKVHEVTVKVDWRNAKRFYVTAIAATTNPQAKDDLIFTSESFERIIALNKFTMVNLMYNFSNKVIGNGKFTGILKENGIYKLVANLIVIAPIDFAQHIPQMGCAIAMNGVKGNKQNGKKYIDQFNIVSISLIEKDYAVDDYCIVKEILKDEDIDKRLESD